MKEIIQKNGKYWKECDIVILPTKGRKLNFKCDCKDEEFHHYHCGLVYDRNNLFLNGDLINLHILTNEQINEGDYYFDKQDKVIFRCLDKQEAKARNDYRTIYNENRWFKVVATTDKSLEHYVKEKYTHRGMGKYWEDDPIEMITTHMKKLPQIHESFIKVYIDSYNAGKLITEVNLEYENEKFDSSFFGGKSEMINLPIYKLKLREDNTVIIFPSKTYTREEVCQIIYNYSNFICDTNCPSELQDGTTSWIEQNL